LFTSLKSLLEKSDFYYFQSLFSHASDILPENQISGGEMRGHFDS